MSAPWLFPGMVHDTAERLYEHYQQSPSRDTGNVYACAIGMIETIATDEGMPRVRDILEALEQTLTRIRRELKRVPS